VNIRKFRQSDRDSVISFWKDVFNSQHPHNDPEIAIDMKIRHSKDLLFVAEENNRVVGTVMAGFDGHRGWIYSLAVKPDFRKKGIGTQLMKEAINKLKSLGCLKVNLQIEEDNSDVVDFYERFGFSIEERISMGMKLY
jgi:hypothetical protein